MQSKNKKQKKENNAVPAAYVDSGSSLEQSPLIIYQNGTRSESKWKNKPEWTSGEQPVTDHNLIKSMRPEALELLSVTATTDPLARLCSQQCILFQKFNYGPLL